ncbi:MAG: baseplate J/gp47 family protein [Lachnospiraceae bacterium]|nr:baseplate J/gp47 family protein [Lachnospiraceae bacterium]
MLEIRNEKNRELTERYVDALIRLPMYSKEWTNYNPSDPGITILEELLNEVAIQGATIPAVTDRQRLALMKLFGFMPRKGKCARILLTTDSVERSVHIDDSQKFMIGDMCFETRKELDIGLSHLDAVYYSDNEEDFKLLPTLTQADAVVPIQALGTEVKEGAALYFICDGLPAAGNECIFYFTMRDVEGRTPFTDRANDVFASLEWEIYTAAGFRPIKVHDYTAGFMGSGEVKIRIPEESPTLFDKVEESGFCLRVRVKRANYDVTPEFYQVDGFLFEAWQRDTRASLIIQSKKEFKFKSILSKEPYFLIFGKEEKGSSYRRYQIANGSEGEGRFCDVDSDDGVSYKVSFNKDKFGYAPGDYKEPVRIISYSEDVMKHYRVGTVYGYDNETIKLPMKNVVKDSFTLIARREDENGEYLYDFVRPDKAVENGLYYHLLEKTGRIVIEDAGDFIGAELFMGCVSVTRGAAGNIRSGCVFTSPAVPGLRFRNCSAGTGGAFRESFEDVRKRLILDMDNPNTAVTGADYERIVRETPGLCIGKVKAWPEPAENMVYLAIMPGIGSGYPKLSSLYKQLISEYLEKRRILTTKFEILDPEYVGVDIRINVYVKPYFDNYKESIEDVLRDSIRYVDGDSNFGDPLEYETVIRNVESLECVEYVSDISMTVQRAGAAKVSESELVPKKNVLLYPGRLYVNAVTFD